MNSNVTSLRSWWTVTGALLAGVAVITGAFGAHGLPDYLQGLYGTETRTVAGEDILAWKKYLADFKTAAEYQMYHGLALVALGLMANYKCGRARAVAAWFFLLGTLLFSGSLYLLVLTGQRWLGMVTPIGGMFFIFGWCSLAYTACPCGSQRAPAEQLVELEATCR
ncbi:MAG: DUF423 domain-containing protein [Planctomycetaceae bacterium]|nr:DUF423 domain-containing protein [Planctomycetaceae bacterium]